MSIPSRRHEFPTPCLYLHQSSMVGVKLVDILNAGFSSLPAGRLIQALCRRILQRGPNPDASDPIGEALPLQLLDQARADPGPLVSFIDNDVEQIDIEVGVLDIWETVRAQIPHRR